MSTSQVEMRHDGLVDRIVARLNSHYVTLVLLPWLLFVINPNWAFQGFGQMDPWYYFGLSMDFPRYQHLYLAYSSERLTWIIPARIFVALLSPVFGWLAFHVCIYYLSVFALYSIIRRLFDPASAFVAATLMGAHPLFIGSNGWTYVDSGAMAYLLLSFAALAAAKGAKYPSAYVILGGVAWAAACYTHSLWWVLTPCCALFYWGMINEELDPAGKLRDRLVRYLGVAAMFGLGIAIMTALMTIAHYCVHGSGGGPFFAQSLKVVDFMATVKKEQVYWGTDSYAWLKKAGWIVFPAFTMMGTAFALLWHYLGKGRLSRSSVGIGMTYSYAFVALLYLQLRNAHVMEFDYYVSILIPLEFLALGAIFLRTPPGLASRIVYVVVGAGTAISILPLVRVGLYNVLHEESLWLHYVLGLAAIVTGLLWRSPRGWACAVIGLAIASFGLVPAYPGVAWTSHQNGLSATERVAEAVKTIDLNTPTNKFPVFWIDDFNDPYTWEYRAIMCALHTHGWSMWRYPSVDPAKLPLPGAELILITREQNIFEGANATMTKAGSPLRMFKQQLISGEGEDPGKRVSYWLTFTDVVDPPHEESSAKPGAELEVVPGAIKLSAVLPAVPGAVVELGPPVHITTIPQKYAYAAYEVLPFSSEDWKPAQVRVSLRVLSGKIGIGILETSEASFYIHTLVEPSGAFQSVTLDLEHPGVTRKLVVSSEAPNGTKAEVEISKVELLAYRSSSLFRRLTAAPR